MEDAGEGPAPYRPWFDISFRGFHRSQVTEHVEMLEGQLRLVTADRNEAVRLNSDLRGLYDSTRNDLEETKQRLHHIEFSDTGLPAASQRVQNMLATAEEEVQTLRDKARRQAEHVRTSAQQEADSLIEQAENSVSQMHSECATLLTEIETKREELRREHAKQVSDLQEREKRMRRMIRDAYKTTIDSAKQEADDIVARTERHCSQRDAQSEQLRLDTVEEVRHKRGELQELQKAVLSALDVVTETIGESATVLHAQTPNVPDPEMPAVPPVPDVLLPQPREGIKTYRILLPNGNGDSPANGDTAADSHDSGQRN